MEEISLIPTGLGGGGGGGDSGGGGAGGGGRVKLGKTSWRN